MNYNSNKNKNNMYNFNTEQNYTGGVFFKTILMYTGY